MNTESQHAARLSWRSLRAAMHGLTAQGRSVIAAGLVIAVFSPLLGEKGLFQIAVLLITLPLLAAVVVSMTRTSVWCRRSIHPARVRAGQSAWVQLQLSTRRRSLQLRLEDIVPADLLTSTAHRAPAAGGSEGISENPTLETSTSETSTSETVGPRFRLTDLSVGSTAQLEYQVLPQRRGHYTLGPLTVQCGDPFGMCTLLQPVSRTQTIIVTPAVIPLPFSSLIDGRAGFGEHLGQTLGAYGDDAAAVRSYRSGDDPRRVHWRSTARAGELMVRQQEQPRHARATLLLDTRAVAHSNPASSNSTDSNPADSTDSSADSFEWAVAATASIAAHLIGQGLRVRLLTDTGQQVTSGESLAGIGSADHVATDRVATASDRPIMDLLAGVTHSERRDLRGGFAAVEDTAGEQTTARGWDGDMGVVIGVFGSLSTDDTTWLHHNRDGLSGHSGLSGLGGLGGRTELSVALIVDGPSWRRFDAGDWFPGMAQAGTAQSGAIPGWRSTIATRDSDIAALWRSLASQRPEAGSSEASPRGRAA
ncbi:MAG: DUF58 domain-containing protein [Mycobacteriales bacterium]